MTSADKSAPQRVSDKERRKGRTSFIVLVVIFFAPLVVASLMFFGVVDWKPTGMKANGELIQPPVQVNVGEPVLLTAAQEPSLLRGKWTLVYVADSCEDKCETSLVLMRQVRQSLGRYLDRISRALVVTTAPTDIDRLTEAFPGMDIVQSEDIAAQILTAAGAQPGERIYLVDPIGNVALMFAHDSEPRPMYNDLKHLLKISRIG
ncbi:MAG: SCO family protein [Gammaproteobacteria bacterium]